MRRAPVPRNGMKVESPGAVPQPVQWIQLQEQTQATEQPLVGAATRLSRFLRMRVPPFSVSFCAISQFDWKSRAAPTILGTIGIRRNHCSPWRRMALSPKFTTTSCNRTPSRAETGIACVRGLVRAAEHRCKTIPILSFLPPTRLGCSVFSKRRSVRLLSLFP